MILDTNALSATADGDARAVDIVTTATQLAIPVVVLGEYRAGIMQSRDRESYEKWLRDLIEVVPVLEINEKTTDHYAAIRVELKRAGKPIPTNDMWIAALCRQHSLPILSRDRHFDLVSRIRRIDW